jgi:hypothetical protein
MPAAPPGPRYRGQRSVEPPSGRRRCLKLDLIGLFDLSQGEQALACPLEDYTNSFVLFFDPERLRQLSPVRYDWMERHVASDVR